MTRKTSREMSAEYEQLRNQAHDKVDKMNRKQLCKFIKTNGTQNTQEKQEIQNGEA
jgi:hypothetical protein